MLTNEQIAEKAAVEFDNLVHEWNIRVHTEKPEPPFPSFEQAILSAIREATACAEERSKQQAERIEELDAENQRLLERAEEMRKGAKLACLIREIAEGSKDSGFSQEFIDRVKQENRPEEDATG